MSQHSIKIAFAILLFASSPVLAGRFNIYLDMSPSMHGAKLAGAIEGAKLFVALSRDSDQVRFVVFDYSLR